MTSPSQPAASCRHERSHISDSAFYGHRYSTTATHRIFCDHCRYQRWLDVEVALAQAQAELGIIPADAAEAIAGAARVELLDLAAITAEIRRTGHSLVGFLRVFQAICPAGSGEFLHYGATTQDIQDTAQSLEMRDVLDELDRLLRLVATRLSVIATEHADTLALGRTHAQPALPLGFGLKIASWVDELHRHAERVAGMRERVLVAQLFGGVGTMASFADRGPELLAEFAARLGLAAPTIGWHVARDRVAEFVMTLAMVAGTMGRIADEVRTLSRPEFGEVEEGWRYGQVGSSTMPHKRNPEACAQAVVMARLAAAMVGPALAAMSGDHERDSRSLRLEWVCVPDVSHYALAGCEIVLKIVDGLVVHEDRLAANVDRVASQVMSEKLMLAIGRHVGKQTAHEQVYELSQQARRDGHTLEAVARAADYTRVLDADELTAIFDPSSYLGESGQLTRAVVAAAQSWLDAPAAAATDGS